MPPPSAPFELRVERSDDGLVVVHVAGELDIATIDRLRDCVAEAGEGAATLRLDLSATEFMDSSGLHLLIGLDERRRQDGATLAIVPSPAVRRVLDITGMHDRLPLA